MTFPTVDRAPGVYIQEVAVPGPIPGVGTSTAAFIGPARRGPIGKPVFLTNWTRFSEEFGEPDRLGPYMTAATVYVTHAVRGFFDNDGSSCYFVRVGRGAAASLTLNDRAKTTARSVLVVTAKQEGSTGNQITVGVQDASIAKGKAVRVQAPLVKASGKEATLSSAGEFRPGDIVVLEEGTKQAPATIASVSGKTIKLQEELSEPFGGGTVRIADLRPKQRTIRLDTIAGIEPGAILKITQGAKTESQVVDAVDKANSSVTLSSQGLKDTYGMAGGDEVAYASQEFTLIIKAPNEDPETFADLSLDPRHSRYVLKAVKSKSVEIELADPPSPTLPPNNLPAVLAGSSLERGQDEQLDQIGPEHYRAAIDALKRVDNVNILCLPDAAGFPDVQKYLIEHCEQMQDRFAILDAQPNASMQAMFDQRSQLGSDRGCAALYYPWIEIANPLAAGRIRVPPSGHVAGVYARTDATRGVHKAPANEVLRGALGVKDVLTDDEQGPLNEQGINVL